MLCSVLNFWGSDFGVLGRTFSGQITRAVRALFTWPLNSFPPSGKYFYCVYLQCGVFTLTPVILSGSSRYLVLLELALQGLVCRVSLSVRSTMSTSFQIPTASSQLIAPAAQIFCWIRHTQDSAWFLFINHNSSPKPSFTSRIVFLIWSTFVRFFCKLVK